MYVHVDDLMNGNLLCVVVIDSRGIMHKHYHSRGESNGQISLVSKDQTRLHPILHNVGRYCPWTFETAYLCASTIECVILFHVSGDVKHFT